MKWLKVFDTDFIGFGYNEKTWFFRVPRFMRALAGHEDIELRRIDPVTLYALELLGTLAANGVTKRVFRRSEPLPILQLAGFDGSIAHPLSTPEFGALTTCSKSTVD